MTPELIAILKEGGGWAVAVVAIVLLVRSNDARINEIKETISALTANTHALEKLTTLISERMK